MSEKQEYLNELKAELDKYTQKFSKIKNKFKGNTKSDTKDISDSLQSILQKANTAYSELKSATSEEWKPMKKISEEAFNELKNSFNKFLDNSSGEVKEYANQIENFSEEQLDAVAEYIKNNPFKSVLIAAGLGYIIGKFK